MSLARLLALGLAALAAIALGTAALSGCTAQVGDEPLGFSQQAVSPPTKAYCTIPVTGKGTKNMEEDYLPHVIQCENGGANLQALKAQAIAARSVAYYAMATKGSICDGQGCQVYSCGATPNAKQIQAVKETAGMYLSYGGMLTYGFYVNGDSKTAPPSCKGSSSVSIEKYITYNEGKTGTNVQQTSLGYIGPPGYGQNRGCMGQWGARCLENNKGYDYKQILQFYYGKDIKILTATGSCVTPVDTDGDGVADSTDNCKTVKNAGQLDTDGDGKGDACDGDDDDDGVKDADDNCPKTPNAGQADSDNDGIGDACEKDTDGDGVVDDEDICPDDPDPQQLDTDKDGFGDACDDDDDDDGVLDADDNCPLVANPSQDDANDDGVGDACEGNTGSGGAGGSSGSGGTGGTAQAGTGGGGGSQQTKLLDSGDDGGCSVRALPTRNHTGAALLLLLGAGVLSLRRRR